MFWIKIEGTLPDHPKVYELAERLAIDPDAAVGKLIRLWTWIVDNRPDGCFTRLDSTRITEIMRCKMKPDKLLSALIDVGLVDELGNEFAVHDWNEYAGALLEQRKKNKERVARCRKKQETVVAEAEETEECNGYCNVTVTPENETCNGVRLRERLRDKKDDDDAGSRAREANVDYSLIRLRATEHFTEAWGRKPTNAEMTAAVRWYCMGTPEELIWEAYRRAAMAGAKNAFSYAASCIDRWEHEGITSLEALIEADFEREKKRG